MNKYAVLFNSILFYFCYYHHHYTKTEEEYRTYKTKRMLMITENTHCHIATRQYHE